MVFIEVAMYDFVFCLSRLFLPGIHGIEGLNRTGGFVDKIVEQNQMYYKFFFYHFPSKLR